MPALETFDWFKKEIWPTITEETQTFLKSQRDYLLTIRNENERRRFIDELIIQLKKVTHKEKS